MLAKEAELATSSDVEMVELALKRGAEYVSRFSTLPTSTPHPHHRQHGPHLAAGLHIRLPPPPLLLSSCFSHRHTLAVAALVRALVSVEIPVDVEILSS